VSFAKALQEAYSGTTLASENDFQDLLSFDANSNTSSSDSFSSNILVSSKYLTLEQVSTSTSLVEGVCGSSGGQNLSSIPTGNLCTTGTATTV
jgi:hypothetical protein